MDIPAVRPRALRPGDTIGIIAPAGPIENREALYLGIAALERLGFRVRFDDRIFESLRYLAGSDRARAEELMRSFEDPGIQAILALRGGFGCSRLIGLLDEKRLRHNPKLFMGFSDLTTLHLFFRRRFGWITIHGPNAMTIATALADPEQERHLCSLWRDPGYLPRFLFPQATAWLPGTAEGKITGGCLSLVVASLGTPYEIKTEGKILFLEDLGEAPYRVDRMLTQLKLAGKVDEVAGILLGTFHECKPDKGDYTVEETLRDFVEELGVPALAGFPAGHGPNNWALPLGVSVRIEAESRQVEVIEPVVEPA